MSLPHGWAETTLGEIAELGGEKADPAVLGNLAFIGLEHVEPHTGQLLGQGDATNVRSTVVRFEPNDVLFGRLRPYLNKVWLADAPGCASAEMIVVRPRERVAPRFVQKLMMTAEFLDFTAALDRGDRPRVNADQIGTYCLLLPPLAEQRRIVAKLDALTVRLARAKAEAASVRDLAARVRQTSLQQAFSSEQLSSWPSVALENVIADGLIGLVRSKAEQGQAGVPYLRMGHYDLEGRLNDRDLSFVSCTRSEIKKFEVRADDVLFNTRNSVELVGKVAIWPADKPGWVYNNNILRLRFHPSVLPRFAFRYMMSPTFRQMMSEVKSATTSVAAIYQRSLYATPFPVPPITVQEAILHQLNTAFTRADRLEAEANKALALIDRLETAILAKAFRGELVPQDPNDEPASVLLERIRARRAADPTAKRGRRPKLAS
ncbi:MAG: restriction endonuclease subunit S [Bordetella sp.]|nr:restriction endonuclease subunit S [Bordetella sp.]